MIVPHKRNLPNLTKSTETLSLPEHILECIYDDNDITKTGKIIIKFYSLYVYGMVIQRKNLSSHLNDKNKLDKVLFRSVRIPGHCFLIMVEMYGKHDGMASKHLDELKYVF